MSPRNAWQRIAELRQRFGWSAVLLFLVHAAINRVMFFDWLDIIVLDRDTLRPMPSAQAARFTARIATRDELAAMRSDPQWEINDEKLRNFDAGDNCVLSLLDGQLAGYTWVHTRGQPELMPGLRLGLPPNFLYNYAGLTASAHRGAGLQSMRHHSVLNQPDWRDRDALLGYVRHVNFASRKGQSKSGYRKVGSIWLLGHQRWYATWLSPSVRRLGISHAAAGALDAEPPAPAATYDTRSSG